MQSTWSVQDSATDLLLEPLLRVISCYFLEISDSWLAMASFVHSKAWSWEDDVEVHAVDTWKCIWLAKIALPVLGSYLIPRSICSSIPNPKFPVAEKFLFLSSYSLTLSAFLRSYSAFWPLTVQWQAMFSRLLIPNVRIVYRADDTTGSCPVKSFITLVARVSLSPLSPRDYDDDDWES